MNIGAIRNKEERDKRISDRLRYQDLAARAPMPPEVDDEDEENTDG